MKRLKYYKFLLFFLHGLAFCAGQGAPYIGGVILPNIPTTPTQLYKLWRMTQKNHANQIAKNTALNNTLIDAVKRRDLDACCRAVKAGADVNHKCKYHGSAIFTATPLSIAMDLCDSWNMVTLLGLLKADLNTGISLAYDFYKKPTQEKQRIFDWLLQEKADINSNDNLMKMTPLRLAVWPGNDVDFALYLLSRKADVNKQDMHGYTPLHTAYTNQRMVELLIACKANLLVQGLGNKTPLEMAINEITDYQNHPLLFLYKATEKAREEQHKKEIKKALLRQKKKMLVRKRIHRSMPVARKMKMEETKENETFFPRLR